MKPPIAPALSAIQEEDDNKFTEIFAQLFVSALIWVILVVRSLLFRLSMLEADFTISCSYRARARGPEYRSPVSMPLPIVVIPQCGSQRTGRILTTTSTAAVSQSAELRIVQALTLIPPSALPHETGAT